MVTATTPRAIPFSGTSEKIMDLTDTDGHREFRADVRAFIARHRDSAPTCVAFTQRLNPKPFAADVRAWQALLVDAASSDRVRMARSRSVTSLH